MIPDLRPGISIWYQISVKEMKMPFLQGFQLPPKIEERSLWFFIQDQKLLLRKSDEAYDLPRFKELEGFDLIPEQPLFLGSLDGIQCLAADLPEEMAVPDIFTLRSIRTLLGRIDDDLAYIAGLANQLVHWNMTHTYCGRCGSPFMNMPDERAKQCPNCGLINYPRLSPAVIVAILKDEEILLANSQRFPAKFYSVLAGFVEPGETLEDCVKREILEEVGIEVKNIRYFGSQPWPFPDSLMIAFTAEYSGGKIAVDYSEILDAGWFSAENLPNIPPRFSIARQLIDWFVNKGS